MAKALGAHDARMEPISVVTATYNRAGLLPHTLRSVLATLAAGDEIIVADDGSTDATEAIVTHPSAPWAGRVRYLHLPKAGAGAAFNAGIAQARHDLVAFVDSDDLWLAHRLAIQRPVMRDEPGLAFCFSNFGHLARDRTITPHWLVEWSRDTRPWDEILAAGTPYGDRWKVPASVPDESRRFRIHIGSMYRRQLHANYIGVNTLIARRSVTGAALRFGEGLPRLADWECYARIARTGPCAYLDVDTALQREHPGPRLSQTGPINYLVARIEIIERTWGRDDAFMAEFGDEVRGLLAQLRLTLVRALILANRAREAREILPRVPGAWIERIAVGLPDSWRQLALAWRRGEAPRFAGEYDRAYLRREQ